MITTTGIIGSVCSGTGLQNASLVYSATVGNPTSYTIDWDETANIALLSDQDFTPESFEPNGGAGTITTIEIPANIAPGTYSGNLIISNTNCFTFQPVSITILPATVGGTVTGGTTIGTGSTSGLLTLSGHTGSVVKWQSSVSPFTTWTDIANTAVTYTSGALTETTQFRAVVKSSTCDAVNSEPTTVTVVNPPTIELASSEDRVCVNDGFGGIRPLVYTTTTGDPITYSVVWNSSPANNLLAVTDASLPASPITITVPAGTAAGIYTGTLTVKNATGISSSGSTFEVNVVLAPKITTEGVIDPVFASANVQYTTLAYSDVTYNPDSYEIIWDSNDIENQTRTSFAFSPGGGIIDNIEIPANVPAGTYSATLRLYGSVCLANYPGISITINAGAPTITLETTLIKKCLSGQTSQQTVPLPYTATTGNPVTYSIVWDSSPANTFVAVTDAALPASPIQIVVPFNAANGTYTGTLTVKNGNGVVSSPVVFNVGVSNFPLITTTGTISPVTTSNTLQNATLAYSAVSGTPDGYIIDWDETANAASLSDQPNTAFVFSSGGGIINNIEIPANVPPGTYSGLIRLVFGVCTGGGSSVTITINSAAEPPTITTAPASILCLQTGESTPNSVTYTALSYSATTGSPVTYSIVWDSSPANNLVAVTDEELSANLIFIPLAPSTPIGIYTGTITVKNAQGVSSLGSTFNLKIDKTPTITIFDQNIAPVCSSPFSQTTTLEYSAVTGNPISYYIDWNATANAASLSDQPSTPFEFEGIGGLIDSIQVTGNVPAGTYSGTLYIKNSTCTEDRSVSLTINPAPTAPVIGEITPSPVNASTGSVALSGLPTTSGWAITTSPPTTTLLGSGASAVFPDLAPGNYAFTVTTTTMACSSVASEFVEVPAIFFRDGLISSVNGNGDLDSLKNPVSVSSFNKVINVETPNQIINEVYIFDVSGTLIYKKGKVSDSKLTIDNLRSGNQVLVVKVILDNNQTETRKIIF